MMLRALDGAELWAVVKAEAYGHGALDAARAALDEGAAALCVATVGEALPLRAELPEVRIIVMGQAHQLKEAREAKREVTVRAGPVP